MCFCFVLVQTFFFPLVFIVWTCVNDAIHALLINAHWSRLIEGEKLMRRGGSPGDPTSESSSLGNEQDFFSASRIRTCSWTLRALATGSGDGPSEGTMYAVQDVFGCTADRKHLSATATLILSRTEKQDDPVAKKSLVLPNQGRGAARPVDDFVCSNVGCEMEISRCVGGTCGAGGGGRPQSTYRQDNSITLQKAGCWSRT